MNIFFFFLSHDIKQNKFKFTFFLEFMSLKILLSPVWQAITIYVNHVKHFTANQSLTFRKKCAFHPYSFFLDFLRFFSSWLARHDRQSFLTKGSFTNSKRVNFLSIKIEINYLFKCRFSSKNLVYFDSFHIKIVE